MDDAQVKRLLEALLFVVGEPLPLKRIQQVLPDVESAKLRVLLHALNGEYLGTGRAFQIQEVAGGYQLVTDQALSPWIRKALQSPKPDAVSAAALETLAIIAYRQPTTKAEIEAIRGVDVTVSLETLLERKFARLAGRKDSPGRPFLYATTTEFLRHFGLKSLGALPSLGLPALKEPEADPSPPAAIPAGVASAASPVPDVA